MSDAAIVQIVTTLITTLGTITTVILTGRQNRRRIDKTAGETHKRLETINKRVSGEWPPVRETPLSVAVVDEQRPRPHD